jgi:hypothetical protein
MNTPEVLKIAYILGCKMAEIDNANILASNSVSVSKKLEEGGAGGTSDYGNLMQNGEARQQTEAGTQYGPKHQLATTPEWSGA